MDLFTVTIDKEELIDIFDDFEKFSNFCDNVCNQLQQAIIEQSIKEVINNDKS